MQTQMNFTAAKAAREKGHAAGDACARKAGSEWVEEALYLVGLYAASEFTPSFTIEQLREWMVPSVLRAPHDSRAWGTVTRQAVARGIIVRTGGYRAAVSSNGSPKPLYRKA